MSWKSNLYGCWVPLTKPGDCKDRRHCQDCEQLIHDDQFDNKPTKRYKRTTQWVFFKQRIIIPCFSEFAYLRRCSHPQRSESLHIAFSGTGGPPRSGPCPYHVGTIPPPTLIYDHKYQLPNNDRQINIIRQNQNQLLIANYYWIW